MTLRRRFGNAEANQAWRYEAKAGEPAFAFFYA